MAYVKEIKHQRTRIKDKMQMDSNFSSCSIRHNNSHVNIHWQ